EPGGPSEEPYEPGGPSEEPYAPYEPGGPSEIPYDPEGPDCTRTQGYWKNHGWGPVTGLWIGAAYYEQNHARTILRTSPRGDASLILAHQLIAALLNVAHGATPHWAIDAAQTWMARNGTWLAYGTTVSDEARARAIALNELLTAYNEGREGSPHCDSGGTPYEPPPTPR